MKNLNEVFTLMLKEYQKTGNLDAAINVINLSPEQKERIRKAFLTLDKIEANAKSLQEAKKEGISRKNWFGQQILDTAEKKHFSDKETEEAFAAIGKNFADDANKIKIEKED